MNSLPRVVLIGLNDYKSNEGESIDLNLITLLNDHDLVGVLVKFNPDSIITIGGCSDDFSNLSQQSLDVRRRWVHLENEPTNLGEIAYQCASNYILNPEDRLTPLISFFTPVHNTGERLLRTFESIKHQTYNNWEWVIVNDSSLDDAGFTLGIAERIAESDCRVKVYDFKVKSGGIIGEAKYRAASLCKGTYLMELDHDDYLLPDAAYSMVAAFQRYPECKFVYSDCAEIDENHRSMIYGENFAFGYGSYSAASYRGRIYQVANSPNVNPKTIRHIVGVPNHFRAWEKNFYLAIGGHNRRLTIADDYELLVRTFLNTKFVRIPKLLYLQFIHDSNTQNKTRREIQRRVNTISHFYNDQIRDRFVELGRIDWAYAFNKNDPLSCPSQFGDDEHAVNEVML